MDDTPFEAARAAFLQGLAALEAGRPEAAEAALRESLARLPGRPSTLVNLAVALLRQGRAAEALPLLDEVLARDAGDVDAIGHRGVALAELRRTAEAVAAFEQVLARAPDRPEAWFHHAQALQTLGRPDAALRSYERCLALAPAHAQAWSQRGGALKDLGRTDDARASFERALALGADAELNRYYLASLDAGAAPPAPPRAFVERLFDDYAPDFDRHLLDTLEYRVPEHLARILAAKAAPPFGSALDLGCGTGLAAAPLAPMVDALHGVDLSAAMLDRARGRGLYASLEQAELADHLQTTPRRHDLVVAADVFIYLGDLAPVFAGVRRVLRPRGAFAFSAELASGDRAWSLQPSLRYAHGERALQALASDHGFTVRHAERATLRLDQQREVPGLMMLLQAPP